PGAGGAGDTGARGAAVTTGAGGTRGTAATGPRGARTSGAGAAGTGGVGCVGARDPTEPGAAIAGGTGAGGAGVGGPGAGGAGAAGAGVGGTGVGGAGAARAGAVDPGAGGAGGTVRPRPYFVPLLQQVLGVPSSTGLPPPFLCPPPDQTQPPLQPASPLPAPSPYTEKFGGLTEHREPASHPVSPVRTAPRAPRLRPPPVPGTHAMAIRPSSVPLRVPLLAPPESSLLEVPYPASDRAHAANPTVSRFLTTAVSDPSFESAVASALVAELLDFGAACRLDYATVLVAESVSASPPSVGGECALGTDVLEGRQEDFECLAAAVPRFASMLLAPEGDPDAPDIPTPRSYTEAITGPYSSQWQAAMDAEMASWKSTCTYIDEVPPSRANIVDGMWIFRGVDYFQTFSPTPKMTTLWVTAFLQGSLHEEIWLRRPPGFTGSFPTGTQWSLCRLVYGLRQAPREWHDTLRTTPAGLGFAPSTADPSLFLRTDTLLPPFYILMYVNDLVFATADTEALTLVKSELQKRHTYTDLGELRSNLGLQIIRDRARRTITLTQSHMVHQSVEPSGPYPELVGYLMYLMTTSGMELVLGGRGPVVLIGHADASWVDDSATQRSSQGYTFSLGSGSVSRRSTRSSSVLSSSCEAEIYAGAMAAQELRWLTYLLTDLGEQPRSPPVLYCGQLRLAYMATRANTADIFTKALPPGDHQRFATVLGLLALLFLTGLVTTCSPPLCLRGTTLAALGFTPSTADPSLFLHTDTLLPPLYVLVYVLQRFGFQFSSPQPTPPSTSHSLSAPPSNEPVEPSGPYPELVGCLITSRMGLVLGGRGPVVLIGHADASWVDNSATPRSSLGYTFSLGSGSVSRRSTRSSLVLSSSCLAEIYAGAMAAQELHWLTYLLTDLGEQPRSPPQRGLLRLAYVATKANTADIFTKALPPGDHHHFSTVLGLLALLFLTGLVTTCSPPLCLRGVWGWRVGRGGYVASPAPPPPLSPTAAATAEGGGCVGAKGVVLEGGV
ncbi:unnamed protein product, partial [Closterium sp. NIES-53]